MPLIKVQIHYQHGKVGVCVEGKWFTLRDPMRSKGLITKQGNTMLMVLRSHSGLTQNQLFILSTQISQLRKWTERVGDEKEMERGEEKTLAKLVEPRAEAQDWGYSEHLAPLSIN